MTIRPRGNSFLVDVKVGPKENPTGKVVRVRSTCQDEITAKRLEAEIRAAIMKHGQWTPNTPSAPTRSQGTLAAALEEAHTYPSGKRRGWKYQKAGHKQYARAEKCINLLGPERHCATVTTDDFDRLTQQFEALGNTSDTINYKLQALRRVLWHAQRKGWITHRPLWDRPSPGQPREFMYDEDLERRVEMYFRTVEQHPVMADLFILGIETGLRLGELLSSLCGDWQVDNGIVVVRAVNAKSGQARAVTLTDRAKDIIRPHVTAANGDLRKQLFPMSGQTVSNWVRKARVYLGYEGTKSFCFHATRHTRATRLARQTRDPFLVMTQLGHQDIKVSMRYIKMASIDVTIGKGAIDWDTGVFRAPVPQT
ncbi:tyrosine-type recombinase/integrase [Rhizobium sp. 18065]|uniref:tyrosine-type recombinase/integrase n=1 Tax=Rhizobium sp. 18065 TaxID=2681411 RepID=UPI0013582B65|nr:tyrosine-type recombinase/integrase [Rhizobium sp. 18065]